MPASISATAVEGLGRVGLFLLHNPPAHHDSFDIIAVHDLHGDPYLSWTHPNGRLWLRDMLPTNIPPARIFSFGYDSSEILASKRLAQRDPLEVIVESLIYQIERLKRNVKVSFLQCAR